MLTAINNIKLGQKESHFLRDLIEKELGICLSEKKHSLLESRLQKRLKFYSFHDFDDYCTYLSTPHGFAQELPRLTDAVTTNKTDFFREPEHFHFLEEKILRPALKKGNLRSPYRIWSSACSSGEEVYTTAMVMDSISEDFPDFDYNILGTDISDEILYKAQAGIYPRDRVSLIDYDVVKKYFLKGKGNNLNRVCFKQNYRNNISFSKLNLLTDIPGMESRFDLIFCRNVLIYFSRETQAKILLDMYDRLHSGGYLILGHSEFITGIELPYKQVAPTVYRK